MSKVYENYKSKDLSEPSGQWYLKLPGGTVYGPVDISLLRDWAAKGRIVVGNMVSSDNEKWIAAESVPQLNMTWVAELKNGQRQGPFNVAAVPLLVQRGKLSRSATVQNTSTGEMLSVSSILKFGTAASQRVAVVDEHAESGATEIAGAPPQDTGEPPPVKSGPSLPAAKPAGPAKEEEPAGGAVAPRREPELVAGQGDSLTQEREQELDRRIGELSKETEEYRKKDEVLLASMDRLEKKVLSVSQRLRQAQTQLEAKTTPQAAPERAADGEHARERIRQLVARLEEIAGRAKQRVEEERSPLVQEIEALKRRLADMEKASGEKEAGLKLRAGDLEAEADEKGRRITELEAALNREHEAAEVTKAEGEERIKALNGRIGQFEKELDGARKSIGLLMGEVAEVEIKRTESESRAGEMEKGLAGRIEALTQESRAAAERAVVAGRELEERRKAYEELELRGREREKELIEQVRKLGEEAAGGAKSLEAAVAEKSGRVEGLEAEIARERALLAEMEAKARGREQELTERVERMQAEAGAAGEQLDRLKKELSREQGAAEVMKAKSEAQIEALNERIGQFEKQLVESGKSMEALRGEAAEAERRRTESETRAAEMEKELKEAKARAAEIEKELKDAKAAAAKVAGDRAGLMQCFLAPPKGEEPGWYLKGEDKTVYGPVDLYELWTWACQCRIGPSHEISQDKQTWIRAEGVPELRMDWTSVLSDGSVMGPLNPLSFRELVEEGLVSSESGVRNRLTGETMLIGELLKAAEEGTTLRRGLTEPEAQEWKQRCAEAEARSQRMAEELAQKNALLLAEQIRRQQIEQELANMGEKRAGLSVQPQQSPPAMGEGAKIPPNRLRERFLAVAQSTRPAKDVD